MDILLRSFINRLESLPDKPALDELRRCVVEMEAGEVPIEEYISFSEQQYKRNIIHVRSKCEVVVLCFKEGQTTPIHDHGGSLGVTIVREGIMKEELFKKQSTDMIAPAFTRKYYTCELAYVDLTTIHRVSNVHRERLVTINVYFPPLTLMNIYNLENTSVEKWVADYSKTKGV